MPGQMLNSSAFSCPAQENPCTVPFYSLMQKKNSSFCTAFGQQGACPLAAAHALPKASQDTFQNVFLHEAGPPACTFLCSLKQNIHASRSLGPTCCPNPTHTQLCQFSMEARRARPALNCAGSVGSPTMPVREDLILNREHGKPAKRGQHIETF